MEQPKRRRREVYKEIQLPQRESSSSSPNQPISRKRDHTRNGPIGPLARWNKKRIRTLQTLSSSFKNLYFIKVIYSAGFDRNTKKEDQLLEWLTPKSMKSIPRSPWRWRLRGAISSLIVIFQIEHYGKNLKGFYSRHVSMYSFSKYPPDRIESTFWEKTNSTGRVPGTHSITAQWSQQPVLPDPADL